MAPKRVNDGVEPSGAEKKRLKIRDQRQIPVEGGQGGRAGGSAPSGEHIRVRHIIDHSSKELSQATTVCRRRSRWTSSPK